MSGRDARRPDGARSRSSKPLVLVVDDDEATRDVVAAVLEDAGYAVRTAGDGAAALLDARELVPRCIVLDLHVPLLDGWEVAIRLKTDPATRRICLLAHTASSSGLERQRALSVGCDGYLAKPATAGTLVAAVTRLVASVARDVG